MEHTQSYWAERKKRNINSIICIWRFRTKRENWTIKKRRDETEQIWFYCLVVNEHMILSMNHCTCSRFYTPMKIFWAVKPLIELRRYSMVDCLLHHCAVFMHQNLLHPKSKCIRPIPKHCKQIGKSVLSLTISNMDKHLYLT